MKMTKKTFEKKANLVLIITSDIFELFDIGVIYGCNLSFALSVPGPN